MDSNIHVHFENTPNPSTMKFIFNQKITDQSAEFTDAKSTSRSALAAKIFGFPWVASVFISSDFITITKQDWVAWDIIAEPLSHLLEEHVSRNGEVLQSEDLSLASLAHSSPEVQMIQKIFDDEIRPAVAMDGGDIIFHKYENKVVYVYMQGACSGCPSSMMTLKEGVESRLKQTLPEIKEVVAL